MGNKSLFDWIFRFVKGMFIGVGAILPGVSGGALAAVFGIYERLIAFMANITKDFKKNFIYFLPVGLGGVFGIFVLSFAISFFFEVAEIQILWFFVGCIVGILPSLFKEAGKKGRKPVHIIVMVVSAVVGLIILLNLQSLITGTLPQNVFTWIFAGVLMGLGMIIPGLSPSNFLVYLNLYKDMTDGIKDLNFAIILPIVFGVVITAIGLSKIMNFIFERAYAYLFHVILGIVIASTIIIIPRNFNYFSIGAVFCAAACLGGVWLGVWMSKLEEKYKP